MELSEERHGKIVAFDGGKEIGHVAYELDGTRVKIVDIEVIPERRRQGVAARLLDELHTVVPLEFVVQRPNLIGNGAEPFIEKMWPRYVPVDQGEA